MIAAQEGPTGKMSELARPLRAGRGKVYGAAQLLEGLAAEEMMSIRPLPNRRPPAALLLSLLLGLAAGCTKSIDSSAPAPVITPEVRAEAAQLYTERCQTCHGATGRGDGPAAVGLNPRPRNFTDTMWQSNVTDLHIERIIQFGGPSVGKSPAMAPNPDLISKPAVVAALRERVRALGRAAVATPEPSK